jgi:uncharacterized protein YdgA (DUF945 family)
MRKITGIVLSLILVIFISPWLLGWWLQHVYQELITSYNKQGNVVIEVMHYHRHWLSTDAKFHIQIINPAVRQLFVDAKKTNPNLEITVAQHIQHGPILSHKTADMPSMFGLAFIYNSIDLSEDIKSLFQATSNQAVSLGGDDYISFAGNYLKHIVLSPVRYVYKDANLNFEFKQGIQGHVWIYPNQHHFSGEFELADFVLKNGDDIIGAPNIKFIFDQHQSINQLWIGHAGLELASLSMRNDIGDQLAITGVNFQGDISEASGELSDARRLTIEKIEIDGETFGPVHLKLKTSGLSAKAITDLIATYQKINQQGELYASQLKLKMLSLIPGIFSGNAEIKLEDFDVVAKEGRLQAKGKMDWFGGESSVSDFSELLDDSNIQGKLRISKVLANRFVEYASQMPFFRTISRKRRMELLDLQDNIELANQRNFLYLVVLVDGKTLAESSALNLLGLQKSSAPLSEYAKATRDLFLGGQIDRLLSYRLLWLYIDIKQRSDDLDQALLMDDKSLRKSLHTEFNDWVKAGYITQDKEDYVISIQKEQSLLKLNGKEVLSLNKVK